MYGLGNISHYSLSSHSVLDKHHPVVGCSENVTLTYLMDNSFQETISRILTLRRIKRNLTQLTKYIYIYIHLTNYLNRLQYVAFGTSVSCVLLCAQNGDLLEHFHGEELVDVATIRLTDLWTLQMEMCVLYIFLYSSKGLSHFRNTLCQI